MLIEDLKRYAVFTDFDELEMRKVFQFCKYKRFYQEQVILEQGVKWAGFFYILEGTLQLQKVKEDGSVTILDDLQAGEFIGETSLFGDVKESECKVVAASRVDALWVNTLDYRRLQNSGPMLLTKMLLRLIILIANEFRQRNGAFAKLKKELEELEKN